MEKANALEIERSDLSQKAKNAETCSAAPDSAGAYKPIAAGLFGHSILYDRSQSLAPMIGYVRDLEQLPNFSLPSIDRFVEQYVRSNIGINKSSS